MKRQPCGRLRGAEEIEQVAKRMAEEHATWGYRRLQGALANLGHCIDAMMVRKYPAPAPQGPPPYNAARWVCAGRSCCNAAGRCSPRRTSVRWKSPRGLHAAMCAAVDRSLRRLPPGEAVSLL